MILSIQRFLLLAVCFSGFAAHGEWFAASTATEAKTSFDFHVIWDGAEAPTEEEALDLIDEQLLHLFGPLSEHEFPGVPKGNHEITGLAMERVSPAEFKISYHYNGTLMVSLGPKDTYEVALPYNPRTIYQASAVTQKVDGKDVTKYPCTDDYYDTEDDFWYFWSPDWEGCPLIEKVHYEWISAQIERKANTVETYPEYPRMIRDGEIHVSVLLGKDEATSPRNPLKSKDESAENFRKMREQFLQWGFSESVWTRRQVRLSVPEKIVGPKHIPYVAEFLLEGKRATVRVRMFYGETGIEEESLAFHYFLKDALEDSAVMIYNGHSGLGGNLDLEDIEDTRGFALIPNPLRYQIYFFDSCSSYPYYNTMYFDRKRTDMDPRGTKNLDIMTNGLWTYFTTEKATSSVLVKAVSDWATGVRSTSYQQMAQEIESNSLFGVNGDEDNPVAAP